MAYSDDAVKAKLSALNETQDSIVTVAQWIMFHRRHADRTASLWLARLQDSPSTAKRLNLIYLANEVVQQSRARAKQDFLLAFEPLIADATAAAYKGASQEIQGKLRRVVEVWRQRAIFDPRIQEQAEKRLEELDKQKNGKGAGGSGARLGGSLFGGGGGVAPELDRANKQQTAVNKAEAGVKAPVNTANAEYAKMTDPKTPVPSAPVRCAKLRGLVKDLMAAQSAVEASMKARSDLIGSLEALIDTHRAKQAEEADISSQLTMKTNTIEIKAREVEDSIMRGQVDSPAPNGGANGPEVESFTPPPPDIESFTPPPAREEDSMMDGSSDDPAPLLGENTSLAQPYATSTGADPIAELPPNLSEPAPSYMPPPPFSSQQTPQHHQTHTQSPSAALAAAQAKDFLETLMASAPPSLRREASDSLPPTSNSPPASSDPRLKRRKLSHKTGDEFDAQIFGDAVGSVGGGVDEEGIRAMLDQ